MTRPLDPLTTPQRLNPAKAPLPRFAGLGASAGFVGGVDKVMGMVQQNRTTEMLVEDVMGFGVLRTMLDMFRQYIIGKPVEGERKLNFPAARERLFREVGSIFTDNFSGGIMAAGMAVAVNKVLGKTNFSNQFASRDTLALFEKLAAKSADPQDFVRRLATTIASESSAKARAVENILWQAVQKGGKAGEKEFTNAAVSIARTLKPNAEHLDWITTKGGKVTRVLPLDELVNDATRFVGFVEKQAVQNTPKWGDRATQILKNTRSINRFRLPAALSLAMGMTFAVPYLNRLLTKKLDGVDRYPGEIGLREAPDPKAQAQRSTLQKLFPYLNRSLSEGKLLPSLMAMIPLPFAFGLFDTTKLSSAKLKDAINPINKGYLGRYAKMMEFGKGFPFTTQNQMASCFAFLIFSRLITSRSDIEFRERLVDSLLGWGIWILATPRIKKLWAQATDKNLLKTVGNSQVLKRRVEIERLMPNAVKAATRNRFILMSAASIAATIGMLGIVEPLLAIKWSAWQAKRSNGSRPGGAENQASQPTSSSDRKTNPLRPERPIRLDAPAPAVALQPRPPVTRQLAMAPQWSAVAYPASTPWMPMAQPPARNPWQG